MREVIVNSIATRDMYHNMVDEWFEKHKYLAFPAPRIGEDRSISQNSLFHVWCTEYAAHLLNKNKKSVTHGELEGMKRHVKKMYYQETSAEFMVELVVNPYNLKEKKRDFTSSKSWKVGEMKAVMDWLIVMAANDDLVLESKGEHAKLNRKENET